MTHRRQRLRRREAGAAAVEFALVLPVLVLLLVGIIEFGYFFFIQATVSGAAREAARSYAIHWQQAGAVTTAQSAASSAVPNPGNVSSVGFSPSCASGVQMTATVTYQYRSLTGWFDSLLGNTITIVGKGTMRCGG